MNKRLLRVVVFALFAGAGFASTAHELECEKTAGIVKLDANGNPLLDASGLPVFDVAPAAVLEVNAYPAAIGFRIGVHNLATDTSVVTSVSDTLLDAIASKTSFGTSIGPGLSLAVSGSAAQVLVVTVDSQQQCLDLFKAGAMGGAPVCQNIAENRFVVSHEAGSAECRAQIICAAAPPPPECDSGQHKCDGQCVSNSDVNSCGASCTPCSAPPEHAHATCNSAACGFECDPGFVRSNRACIAATAPVPSPTCGDTWQGVKQFGTTGNDRSTGVALDLLCNVHVADALLVSFDSSGRQYQHLGTANGEQGTGVSTDAASNRYVVSTSFTSGSPQLTSMVTKFDPDGATVWRTRIGRRDSETNSFEETNSTGIVADAAGNTYAVGSTKKTPGDFTDAFVAKLDASGTEVWTISISYSATNDVANAVALDQAGHVYVTGSTLGDLDGDREDAFVAQLDNATGDVLWTSFYGGQGDQRGAGVGTDAAGNAYVVGSVHVFENGGPTGRIETFLVQYDSEGKQGWVQQIGFGTGSDASVSGAAVAVSAGNVWIAGSTTGTFPGQTGHGVDQSDAFVAKFDAENGTQLKILQFGSDANDSATGIAVDAGGNAYVAGMTGGAGGSDIFVAKIDPNGNLK